METDYFKCESQFPKEKQGHEMSLPTSVVTCTTKLLKSYTNTNLRKKKKKTLTPLTDSSIGSMYGSSKMAQNDAYICGAGPLNNYKT